MQDPACCILKQHMCCCGLLSLWTSKAHFAPTAPRPPAACAGILMVVPPPQRSLLRTLTSAAALRWTPGGGWQGPGSGSGRGCRAHRRRWPSCRRQALAAAEVVICNTPCSAASEQDPLHCQPSTPGVVQVCHAARGCGAEQMAHPGTPASDALPRLVSAQRRRPAGLWRDPAGCCAGGSKAQVRGGAAKG